MSELKKAFEESKTTLEFLNYVIALTAGEVDTLRELADTDEAKSRNIKRNIDSLKFVSDLVELKKKVESAKLTVNTEITEEDVTSVLKFFLKRLQATLLDFNIPKEDIKEIYRVLLERLSNFDEIKDFVAESKVNT